MRDQIGLMAAELVALATAEERALVVLRTLLVLKAVLVLRTLLVLNALLVLRTLLTLGITVIRPAIVRYVDGGAHRSVWYRRYSSRARGSIDEMYICS